MGSRTSNMPKVKRKWVSSEEEMGPHGTTNLDEVQKHIHTLDDSLDKLEEGIREGVAEDIFTGG